MFTQHAKRRMQQRAISHKDINALLDWGEEKFERGALIYKGTKKTVSTLIGTGVPPNEAERIKGKYLVLINGTVITAAHII